MDLTGNIGEEKEICEISDQSLIDCEKNYVLRSSHPSPLSAHISFFGCKHFSMANKYLKANNINTINW